jgi:stage V sporulation protein B
MVVGTKNIYEIFYYRLSNSFATLGSIMSGTIIYFFSLLMLGGLGEDDIVLIPRIGQKIAEVLKKLSILR